MGKLEHTKMNQHLGMGEKRVFRLDQGRKASMLLEQGGSSSKSPKRQENEDICDWERGRGMWTRLGGRASRGH